jgi:hypothetical protein
MRWNFFMVSFVREMRFGYRMALMSRCFNS